MRIENKKARFKYNFSETLEAGIALTGSEARAVKLYGVDLANSFCKIINGEAYLINANIGVGVNDNPTRMRKLLLHKNQISQLATKIKREKLTIVPTKLYTRGHLLKLEIALAKGKKSYEKKELIKRRDLERMAEEELKAASRR
jgi:SsrA-binding protein